MQQKIQTKRGPKSYSFEVHWGEVDRLEVMINELDASLKSVQKLLYTGKSDRETDICDVRSKRGLIDILGYGLKYLFGTADARDIKHLTTVCEDLQVFKSRITHAAEQQLTYIR
jgi:hypothetical protein